VLILVNHLVDLGLIVKLTIMWLSVDVQEDLLEIHSRAVVDLPRMKFVQHVEQILIVKWDQMIHPFADAKLIILVIL